MPIGSYGHRLSGERLRQLVTRLVGTLDLHSHYRIRPLLDWVERREGIWGGRPILVLELGCGGASTCLSWPNASRK